MIRLVVGPMTIDVVANKKDASKEVLTMAYCVSTDPRTEWKEAHGGMEPPPNMEFTPYPVGFTEIADYAFLMARGGFLVKTLHDVAKLINENQGNPMAVLPQIQEYVGVLIEFVQSFEAEVKDIQRHAKAKFSELMDMHRKGLVVPPVSQLSIPK